MTLSVTGSRHAALACVTVTGVFIACAAERPKAPTFTREDVIAKMKPYTGPHVAGVDTSTLVGKVMCGYQGWFNTVGDGAGRHWTHYNHRTGRDVFEPGKCSIDFWPDVSELDADEKYATPFRHADGSVAYVFSSYNAKTVIRHFKWMARYGIDGVFVQRFASEIRSPNSLNQRVTVLSNCRQGANRHGRSFAVMYDMDFGAETLAAVKADWKLLVDRMRITSDKAYQRHKGRPVVALWGMGFGHRKLDVEATRKFLTFLKTNPKYGRATIMLGVPTYWRTLKRDCRREKGVHDIIKLADIISPWTVGRYRTPAQAGEYAGRTMKQDIKWCRERGKDFLPVVFPGFSWHNLNPRDPFNAVPRLGGRFLWTQYVEARKAGANMVYQAMFDEMDEGTAIFKCTNDPPVGKSRFLTYEGLPSDHYLWLVGTAGRMIRGQIKPTPKPPERRPRP